MARPMNALSVVTAPAVHLVSAATDLVLRLGGLKASVEPPITEEEIKILLEHGTQAGIFEETEQDMVKSIFNLDQRRVEELMTPRPKVVWIDIDDPLEESCKTMVASGFSYYPVYKDTPDNILGTVSVKDLWARMVSNEPVDLKALVQKPFFVPETIPALEMLERFRESRQHIALVLNEYGGVDGVLTLMDLLEAIVGDLPSLHELSEAGPVRREDGSWLLDGMMAADELKELFNLDKLPGEDDNLYSTLGGFVVMHLERIPTTGDHFESAGLRFEVVDMDGKRVDKVMVTQPAPPLSDVEH
jgi:putative hemolysin